MAQTVKKQTIMEYDRFKERLEKIHRQQQLLQQEEIELRRQYANEHPLNAYKGQRVSFKTNGEWSECGYMVCIESGDEKVGSVLMHKINKDGSESKREFRVFFPQSNPEICI